MHSIVSCSALISEIGFPLQLSITFSFLRNLISFSHHATDWLLALEANIDGFLSKNVQRLLNGLSGCFFFEKTYCASRSFRNPCLKCFSLTELFGNQKRKPLVEFKRVQILKNPYVPSSFVNRRKSIQYSESGSFLFVSYLLCDER